MTKIRNIYKIGPKAFILAIVSLITLMLKLLRILAALSEQIDNLVGVYIPEMCFVIIILMLAIAVGLIEQLSRKKKSIITDSRIPVIRKGSFQRKLIWLGLLLSIPIGIYIAVFFWNKHYYTLSTTAEIVVYIDKFSISGVENIDVAKRIEMELNKELEYILPNATALIWHNVPKGIEDLQERLDWACENGADIIIYGEGDALGIWPMLKICSDFVPNIEFKEHETLISTNLSNFALPDSVRLCSLDSLNSRTAYLALFSLGLVLCHCDVGDILEIEQIETAYNLFSKAVIKENNSQRNCALNYCEALFYRAVTAMILGCIDAVTKYDYNLIDTALKSCEAAIQIKPDADKFWFLKGSTLGIKALTSNIVKSDEYFTESVDAFNKSVYLSPNDSNNYLGFGIFLSEYALRFTGNKMDSLFFQSFNKYEKAVINGPNYRRAFVNWGNALSNYAECLDNNKAESFFIESCNKFEKATQIKPDGCRAYFNWANVLSAYAARQDGHTSISLYLQSFKTYEKAVKIRPNDFEAFNNWGIALSEYTDQLEGNVAKSFIRQSFDKYSEVIIIKPDYYNIYNNWSLSLMRYYTITTNEQPGEQMLKQFILLNKLIGHRISLTKILNKLAIFNDKIAEVSPELKEYSKFLRSMANSLKIKEGASSSSSTNSN